MSALTIQLPDSIRAQVEELARRDGITADQFLATAAAEKVSALRTVDLSFATKRALNTSCALRTRVAFRTSAEAVKTGRAAVSADQQ
jgi:hypothetical protein